MTTLEQAARQALEALHGFIPYLPLSDKAQCGRYDESITALRQALEQQRQEQKPVAWCRSDTVADWKGQILNVAYIFPSPKGLKNPIPLYTEPPLHQPLDIQRIKHIATYCGEHITDEDVIEIARRVEAAHGIGVKHDNTTDQNTSMGSAIAKACAL